MQKNLLDTSVIYLYLLRMNSATCVWGSTLELWLQPYMHIYLDLRNSHTLATCQGLLEGVLVLFAKCAVGVLGWSTSWAPYSDILGVRRGPPYC